ncbi:MAG TPA: hypothetical protein VIE66_13770 [Methylocella sp.]
MVFFDKRPEFCVIALRSAQDVCRGTIAPPMRSYNPQNGSSGVAAKAQVSRPPFLERLINHYFFEVKKMVKLLFPISVFLGLTGVALGIFMGIRQDFTLAPAHAHLNLIGFVALFLMALYYRIMPGASVSRLAKIQASISVLGALAFPMGIASLLLGGRERFEPLVIAGALIVFLGMALFAIIVVRTYVLEGAKAATMGSVKALHFENIH